MGAGAAMVRAIGPPDHMFFLRLQFICRIACEIKRHTGVAICVSGGGRICGAAAWCGGDGAGRECALFVLLMFLPRGCVMPSMLPIPRSVMEAFFVVLRPPPPARLRARCPDAYRLLEVCSASKKIQLFFHLTFMFFCGPATTPPACAFACALPSCISLAGGVFSI